MKTPGEATKLHKALPWLLLVTFLAWVVVASAGGAECDADPFTIIRRCQLGDSADELVESISCPGGKFVDVCLTRCSVGQVINYVRVDFLEVK